MKGVRREGKNQSGRPGLSKIRWIIPAACIAGLGLFLGWNAAFYQVLADVSFSPCYLDRNGKLVNIFLTADDKYRARTNLGDFPPELIEAVLLQEDRYFYGHLGINPGAIFRAGWETYVKRSRRLGASTITMQLARLRYGLYTKNLPGKAVQILGAVFLEICLSKEEILEAYLNLAPCGGNIEGFPAAAWYYFGRDVKNLSRGEILTLAVIPQNPGVRAPRNGTVPGENIRARRILYEAWLVSHPEDAILDTEMDLPPLVDEAFPRRAIHFTGYLNTFPSRRGTAGGIRRTSLDLKFQDLCERELQSFLTRNRSWNIKNGSILLIDYRSMETLAAVGSADFFDETIQGQVNGTTSKRSPGSTLKPFIYALALEQGLIHPEKMLKDTPVGFSEYTPDNYRGDFRGPVKAWYALVDSRNIPAVQLARDIREPDLYDFLKKAGVSGLQEKDHYGLSVVLGSADLTMMELASLYAALPNGGIKRDLRFFTGYSAGDPGTGERILSPEAAAITLNMLEKNPPPDEIRPGSSRKIPVAYKTGTSIGFKDAWSVAVFDRFLLCVWVGNFSGEGNNAFIGRLTATPLQFSIIDALLAEIPPAELLPPRPMPPGVSPVEVCAVSGDIPGEDCPQTVETWFIPGVSPITRCRIHRRVYIDTRTGYRTHDTGGPFVRSEVREFWPTDLLEIFAQAGLPRFSPPPWPPETENRRPQPEGFPPFIISPLANTTYVLQDGSSRFNQLVLLAGADQDGGDLFWFANAMFLGKARPNERFTWAPDPGVWDLSVVDSQGRSAGLRLKVEIRGGGLPPASSGVGTMFPGALLLKSAPPEAKLFHNEKELRASTAEAGLRHFVLEGPGLLTLEAAGYTSRTFHTRELPGLLRDGQLQVKLEHEGGTLEYLREIPTGRQPKSAYFSPEGDRVFVPLLGQPGVDVFRFTGAAPASPASPAFTPPEPVPELVFEKRLAVPGSAAAGFVEALCDQRRRELWVSNMEENRVHIFDLDSLTYKTFANTGGLMPKVIAQNPAGDITVVSNWLSRNISVFDSQTKERLALIPVSGTPRGLAFSPDGKILYTAIFDAPLVELINMDEKKSAGTYRLYEGPGAARHVLYSAGKLFVSDMYRGNVCVLDAATGKLLKAIRAGSNINTIVLSPDGTRIYASSRGRNNPGDYTKPGPKFGAVYTLRTEDLAIEEQVWGRNQPTGLAVSPNGTRLAFTDFLDDNLELYRIR
jgi:penicillin-binding protein 1C